MTVVTEMNKLEAGKAIQMEERIDKRLNRRKLKKQDKTRDGEEHSAGETSGRDTMNHTTNKGMQIKARTTGKRRNVNETKQTRRKALQMKITADIIRI